MWLLFEGSYYLKVASIRRNMIPKLDMLASLFGMGLREL